jgi:hypothetical protein
MDEQKMTLFYLKATGNVFGIWASDVGFEVFGDDAIAYELIMDRLILTPETMPLNINNVKVHNGELVAK